MLWEGEIESAGRASTIRNSNGGVPSGSGVAKKGGIGIGIVAQKGGGRPAPGRGATGIGPPLAEPGKGNG